MGGQVIWTNYTLGSNQWQPDWRRLFLIIFYHNRIVSIFTFFWFVLLSTSSHSTLYKYLFLVRQQNLSVRWPKIHPTVEPELETMRATAIRAFYKIWNSDYFINLDFRLRFHNPCMLQRINGAQRGARVNWYILKRK